MQDPNEEAVSEQKGFYIAFDNVQPKRPKPPLRTKRSPKKERSIDSDKQDQSEQLGRELNQERRNQGIEIWKFHQNKSSDSKSFV